MSNDQIFGEVQLPGMLQDMVLESSDVNEFLDGLAKLAASALSSGGREVFCGVVLLRPRAKGTVASSSDHARRMDEVQYQFDDGPCLRAARDGQVYLVTDFRNESRFGEYTKAIVDHGIRSALGVPIPLDGLAAAGLDLYSPQPDAFSEEAIAEAVGFAREASKSLRMAVRVAHLTDTGEHLKAAMSSRTIIDVAAGIIMGQNRCSHDAAMTILKAASSGRNRKLADVAAAVVTSIGQQPPQTHFDS
ncbi:GAF and ANTAR domain-containing protein [Arthrobacter agilis]|uniref:GAF and ANTAR domain-containing protein n=1 Tax=Arthrobacter agilis TaxID=37921 RepID=UPI00278044E2|nr:GAF and ANTAR domain-containing protein [Arthrobacter agilis]MDQ0734099.1 GAF domain-containing protein [Arthrobacter agilis]